MFALDADVEREIRSEDVGGRLNVIQGGPISFIRVFLNEASKCVYARWPIGEVLLDWVMYRLENL